MCDYYSAMNFFNVYLIFILYSYHYSYLNHYNIFEVKMTHNTAIDLYKDVQEQFDILEKLAEEIKKLNRDAKEDPKLKAQALEFARILNELSENSYEMGLKVRDRASA